MRWGHAALLLIILVGLILLLSNTNTKQPFLIEGDLSYLVYIKEANTVTVRVVYPFSDAQGAVAAVTYLSAVLSAKEKNVIIQTVEGDKCYTNEGNVLNVSEGRCEDIYPLIVIMEGEGRMRVEPGYVEISGPPSHLMSAASYLLKKVYPDADDVYREVFSQLKLRTT